MALDMAHNGEMAMSRTDFYTALKQALLERGIPYTRNPILSRKEVDLHFLYMEVVKRGGLAAVTEKKVWKEIIALLDLPPTCTNAAFQLRSLYMRYLEAFEAKYSPYYRRLAPEYYHNLRSGFLNADGEFTRSSTPTHQQLFERDSLLNIAQRHPHQVNQVNPVTQPSDAFDLIINQKKTKERKRKPVELPPDTTLVPNYTHLDYAGRAGILQRLVFSFQSELDNEIDWALNALLMLTYDDRPESEFSLSFQPGFLALLVGQLRRFGGDYGFEEQKETEQMPTCAPDMEFRGSAPGIDAEAMEGIYTPITATPGTNTPKEMDSSHILDITNANEFFHNEKWDGRSGLARRERLMLLLTALWNASMSYCNIGLLAANLETVHFLIHASMDTNQTPEIRNVAFGILNNIAPALQVANMATTLRHVFLKYVKHVIYEEDDREMVTSALEMLGRLCLCHENAMWFEDSEADSILNESFFARLVALMAGPDVALLLSVLETTYQLTNATGHACRTLLRVHGAVSVLVTFLSFNCPEYSNALTGTAVESEPMFITPKPNAHDGDVKRNKRYIEAFKKAKAITLANEAQNAHSVRGQSFGNNRQPQDAGRQQQPDPLSFFYSAPKLDIYGNFDAYYPRRLPSRTSLAYAYGSYYFEYCNLPSYATLEQMYVDAFEKLRADRRTLGLPPVPADLEKERELELERERQRAKEEVQNTTAPAADLTLNQGTDKPLATASDDATTAVDGEGAPSDTLTANSKQLESGTPSNQSELSKPSAKRQLEDSSQEQDRAEKRTNTTDESDTKDAKTSVNGHESHTEEPLKEDVTRPSLKPGEDALSEGVQVTAALILRNVAQKGNHPSLFLPHLETLTEVTAAGLRHSKYIALALSYV